MAEGAFAGMSGLGGTSPHFLHGVVDQWAIGDDCAMDFNQIALIWELSFAYEATEVSKALKVLHAESQSLDVNKHVKDAKNV